MATMTQEQLTEHIKGIVLPLIKDVAGKDVADAVQRQVEDALKPLKDKQAGVDDVLSKLQEAAANGGTGKPAEIKQREQGSSVGRLIRATAASIMYARSGQYRSPEQILEQWGDKDLSKLMAETREKAMAAGSLADGGAFIPTQFSQDVIELLRPQSAVRKLGPNVIPMPVGSVRIPKITGGTTAYYQGENANATASALTTGNVNLTWKKLTALVPMSNDLLRYSSPSIDSIARDDVVRAIAQRENQAFLRDNGTESAPRGMRYWAPAANIVNSAGTSLANMVTDLGAALLALMNANIPEGRWAWIISPRNWISLMTIQNANGFFVFRDEMMRGTLWGLPFASTTQQPGSSTTGEMTLVNMADAVIGESQSLIIDASQEAAYVDSSGTMTAAFAQDQTVIRAITEHDFAMRRAESVYVIANMSW